MTVYTQSGKNTTLAFVAVWIVLATVVSLAQTNAVVTRAELTQKIQEHADQDWEAKAGPKDELVISLYEGKAGLTRGEIEDIYRERYFQDVEKGKHWWEHVPPWLYAVLTVLAFVWRPLKSFIEDDLKKYYQALFTRLAGAKFFWRGALARYRDSILKQHETFTILFREKPLAMSEVYVPLRLSGAGSAVPIRALDALRKYRRVVVKGVPGAGKSMLLQALLLAHADGRLTGIENNPVPVLVELSRLNDDTSSLQKELVASFDRYGFPNADHFVAWALQHNALLLLLDGLDEVNSRERARVARGVSDLVRKHDCRFVITCRTQVYRDEFTSTADRTLEIAEFGDGDILHFLQPWQPDMKQGQSVEHLMQTLRDRPRILALARNPLLLTMIAYLYTDRNIALPHSRAEFYRRSTALLLEEKAQGELNRFRVHAKSVVLSRLAILFQIKPAEDQDRRTLTYEEVLHLVREVLPETGVKIDDAGDLIEEIVDRSGLLLRVDGGTRFQFTHLTMQEYFAARALRSDRADLLEKYRGDRDTWREVVKLWCGMVEDATEMIRELRSIAPITAVECLAEAKSIKSELADEIVDEARKMLNAFNPNVDAVAKALGLLAGVPGQRGSQILAWLMKELHADDPKTLAAVASAMAYSNREEAARRLFAVNNRSALSALMRMGDVAVPPLLEAKDSRRLVLIKTPVALEAAVSLLWHESSRVSTLAACSLAQCFVDPLVEEILRDVPRSSLGPNDGSYDWVWMPFQEAETSSLPTIAARVAFLLAVHLPSFLSAEAGAGSKARTYQQFELGTIDPRFALPLYVDKRNPIFLEALPGPDSLHRTQRDLARELAENEATVRKATRDDWILIFERRAFEFERSNYILSLGILVSTLILAWTFCLYEAHAFWPPLVAWKLAVWLVVLVTFLGAHMYVRGGRPDRFIKMIATAYLSEMPNAFRTVSSSSGGDLLAHFAYYLFLALGFVGCAPLLIYICSLELAKLYRWPAIVGLWIALYTLGVTVWRMGRRKERLEQNPLRGLIKPRSIMQDTPVKLSIQWVSSGSTSNS